MAVKVVGTEEIAVKGLLASDVSANVEDNATFERLKMELKKHGMVQLPAVLRNGSETRIIAGHHRIRAWMEIGNETVEAVVLEGKVTPEEEFNLVNNLNTVRGTLSNSRLKRVIRKGELDVTKLDLFKYPMTSLVPKVNPSEADDDLRRRARIRDMAMKISTKIAESMLDEMDEAVCCFAFEDKPIAILRINVRPRAARKLIPDLRKRLISVFDDLLKD